VVAVYVMCWFEKRAVSEWVAGLGWGMRSIDRPLMLQVGGKSLSSRRMLHGCTTCAQDVGGMDCAATVVAGFCRDYMLAGAD